MTDFDELERLARAATPGRWYATDADDNPSAIKSDQGSRALYVADAMMPNDQAFIAAANPATILALLSANREMRAALEPFADVGEAVDATSFGQPLFPDDGTAFGCEWSTNGEHRRLVWSDFRRARSALTTQRGDGE